MAAAAGVDPVEHTGRYLASRVLQHVTDIESLVHRVTRLSESSEVQQKKEKERKKRKERGRERNLRYGERS